MASIKRNLVSPNQFDGLIPKVPPGTSAVRKVGGSIWDHIQWMPDLIRLASYQTQDLAPRLKRSNVYETCKAVWEFCYHSFEYQLDRGGEIYKSPSYSWHMSRIKGIDCDDFVFLVGTILYNLKIDFCIKAVSQRRNSHLDHVYVTVPLPGNRKRYVTIDPVLPHFDREVRNRVREEHLPISANDDQTGRDRMAGLLKKAIASGQLPPGSTMADLHAYIARNGLDQTRSQTESEAAREQIRVALEQRQQQQSEIVPTRNPTDTSPPVPDPFNGPAELEQPIIQGNDNRLPQGGDPGNAETNPDSRTWFGRNWGWLVGLPIGGYGLYKAIQYFKKPNQAE